MPSVKRDRTHVLLQDLQDSRSTSRARQAREAGDFDYVEEEEYEEEGNYDESAAEEETISAEEDFDENDVETAEKAGDEE